MELEVAPGERLPEEVPAKAQMAMENLVADRIHPPMRSPTSSGSHRLNIPELVVRPAQTATFVS